MTQIYKSARVFLSNKFLLNWMRKYPIKDLSEWIRDKLNSLPEKDNQGNHYRVGWQLITYLAATAAEGSTNPKLRLLGKLAKKGTKKSFIDLASKKLEEWLDRNLDNPYFTKSCNYCGMTINNWSNYCPYCYNQLGF